MGSPDVCGQPAEYALPILSVSVGRVGAADEALVAHGEACATGNRLQPVGDRRLAFSKKWMSVGSAGHDDLVGKVQFAKLPPVVSRVAVVQLDGHAPTSAGPEVGFPVF